MLKSSIKIISIKNNLSTFLDFLAIICILILLLITLFLLKSANSIFLNYIFK